MSSNRNKKCICGSGKKFKKCCQPKIPKAKAQLEEILHIDRKSLMDKIRSWNFSNHKIKVIIQKGSSWLKKIFLFVYNFFKNLF